jgi:hypothetical protein
LGTVWRTWGIAWSACVENARSRSSPCPYPVIDPLVVNAGLA